MKKFKFGRRISALFIATAMMLGTAISASAYESVSSDAVNKNYVNQSKNMMTPRLNNNVDAYVEYVNVGNTASGTAYLDSYIGIQKQFKVILSTPDMPDSVSGYVTVILRSNETGKAVAGWTITKSDPIRTATFNLPKSGYYTMTVTNNTDTRVSVLGYWV